MKEARTLFTTMTMKRQSAPVDADVIADTDTGEARRRPKRPKRSLKTLRPRTTSLRAYLKIRVRESLVVWILRCRTMSKPVLQRMAANDHFP